MGSLAENNPGAGVDAEARGRVDQPEGADEADRRGRRRALPAADRAVVAAVAEMYATAPPRARRSTSRRGSAYQGCRRTRSAPLRGPSTPMSPSSSAATWLVASALPLARRHLRKCRRGGRVDLRRYALHPAHRYRTPRSPRIRRDRASTSA